MDMMDDHRLDSLRQLFKGRHPDAYLTRVSMENLLAEMQRVGAMATAIKPGQANGGDSPRPTAADEAQLGSTALQEQRSLNGAQEQQSVDGRRDNGSVSGTHDNGGNGANGDGAATAGFANGAVHNLNGSSTSSAEVLPGDAKNGSANGVVDSLNGSSTSAAEVTAADNKNGSANRVAQQPADAGLQESSK